MFPTKELLPLDQGDTIVMPSYPSPSCRLSIPDVEDQLYSSHKTVCGTFQTIHWAIGAITFYVLVILSICLAKLCVDVASLIFSTHWGGFHSMILLQDDSKLYRKLCQIRPMEPVLSGKCHVRSNQIIPVLQWSFCVNLTMNSPSYQAKKQDQPLSIRHTFK